MGPEPPSRPSPTQPSIRSRADYYRQYRARQKDRLLRAEGNHKACDLEIAKLKGQVEELKRFVRKVAGPPVDW